MQQVSAAFLAAVRSGGQMRPRVEVTLAGQVVAVPLVVKSGSVQVTPAEGGPRRRLSVEVVAEDPRVNTYELLEPGGATIRAWWEVQFGGGRFERCPLGVFGVDEQDVSLVPGGAVSVVAPDRWQRVADRGFETPYTFAGHPLTAAAALMSEAVGVTTRVEGSTGGIPSTPTNTWATDRARAVVDLAVGAGYEALIDVGGTPVLRPAPALASTAAWSVDAGEGGTFLSGSRSRTLRDLANVVVMVNGVTDGSSSWDYVIVEDNNPGSPTYVGGPLGRRPMHHTTSTIGTAAQAAATGAVLLDKARRPRSAMTVTAAPNPALEVGDTIGIRAPRAAATPAARELYLIDGITHGLAAGSLAQQITLRGSV